MLIGKSEIFSSNDDSMQLCRIQGVATKVEVNQSFGILSVYVIKKRQTRFPRYL